MSAFTQAVSQAWQLIEDGNPLVMHALGVTVDSPLLGDALARAWLRAFLTRDDRYDDRWVAPVASLSEEDVVDELRAAGSRPHRVLYDQRVCACGVEGTMIALRVCPCVD